MQEVRQDPATGEYVVYENGVEVSRFNPLTSFNGLGGAAPSGGSTMIGTDGKAIPDTTAPAAPQAAPQQALPTTTSPDTGTSYDAGTDYGRSYNQRASGRSSTAWYDTSGSSDPFAGIPSNFGGGQPLPPQYADGSTHPSQGGAPRVAGGMWAAQDDGVDNRQQVYNPDTGAWAGPSGASAARPADNIMYGGGNFSGGGGGGGGGSNMGANSGLGQQMRAKVEGMADKIMGGGGSSYASSTDTTKQYRRDGRRMDRAYEKYNEDLAHPKPLPVRGWVKEQGYKPGSVAGLLDEPGAIFGTEHNLNQFTDHLTDLPMTELAMMSFGTQGKNLLSKTPITKVPAILRQNGVKPTKPEYKRTLDPSKVANRIAEMYGNIGAVNRADLLGNLADASKHSAVRQGLQQTFAYDPGQAFDQMEGYIQAANQMSPMRGTGYNIAQSNSIHRRMLEMAPDILGTKPKHADRAIQRVATEFL